jgi:hypothetical protein
MSDEQLHPPASWDKFEEICADLFSRIWNDPELVRYERSGQRQKGVDIYGKQNGADSGVQCKGKRIWPPTKLTIAEINAEIEEAKKFRPTLKTYIIATTADNRARPARSLFRPVLALTLRACDNSPVSATFHAAPSA